MLESKDTCFDANGLPRHTVTLSSKHALDNVKSSVTGSVIGRVTESVTGRVIVWQKNLLAPSK